MTVIVALILGMVAATASATSASSSKRPPMLSHVTRETLQAAIALAKERHIQAIQQALDHYPTTTTNQKTTQQSSSWDPSTIRLDEFRIQAPGALPDFEDELARPYRRIYVTHPDTPLLTSQECQDVIQAAEDHFQRTNNGVWTMQQSGQYQVAGFWIKDVPAVQEWFVQTVRAKLFPLLARTFADFCGVNSDDPESLEAVATAAAQLCVDNAYLFKYTPETGRRTDVHTDSGCLSFTIALNSGGGVDYQGGGTWFEGLTKVHLEGDMTDNDKNSAAEMTKGTGGIIEMNAGQVTIRPGGVKHCGYAVESGTRYIIGGFCMHRGKPEIVRQLLSAPAEDEHNNGSTGSRRRQDMLEAAVVLNPACDAGYTLLANEYENSGEVEKAKQLLEYCLTNVHPRSGEVAYSLGSIFLQQQAYEQAKSCFDICLQSDDCDVDAMRGMAEACSALGEQTLEELLYRRIVATPGASDKMLASAYCNLGVLYEGKEEEIGFYLQSLKYRPDAFAAQYSLACAYASQEQWQDSVTAFRRAIELAPSEEDRSKTLQPLYMSAAKVVQADLVARQEAAPPRDVMIQRFQELMGVENYNQLATSASQSDS